MATRYILPDVQQVGLIFKMAASIYVFGFLFIQKKIIIAVRFSFFFPSNFFFL